MYRRLFFSGIAAVTLISTGCCGPRYGCGVGGHGGCGWYPGKILGRAFACHGCGIGGPYGDWSDTGGGCGVGCDSCDGHGNWIGHAEGPLEPSPQVLQGPVYYPQAGQQTPKPPAPPKEASSNWGYRRRGVRPASYAPPAGNQPVGQLGGCHDGRCPCGRH